MTINAPVLDPARILAASMMGLMLNPEFSFFLQKNRRSFHTLSSEKMDDRPKMSKNFRNSGANMMIAAMTPTPINWPSMMESNSIRTA